MGSGREAHRPGHLFSFFMIPSFFFGAEFGEMVA
jgi:hypothetical protein